MERIMLPPELPHFETHYRYAGCFSAPECAELIRLAEAKGMQLGSIGNGAKSVPVVDTSYRCALTARITPDDAPWAFKNLIEKVTWANAEYRFDLHGLYEDIGVMRYDAPEVEGKPAGHYRWHQDFGGGIYSRRKVSIVALLNDPIQFSGGELRLFNSGETVAALNEPGDMVMFPSWTPHCVTDVTAGRRYSLVAWVSGARFR
jgi:PKHD-type hydroxylase